MSDLEVLACPKCGGDLYVRHVESGKLVRPTVIHQVTNVYWQAECHDCEYKSAKRGTVWSLVAHIGQELQEQEAAEA